MNIFHVIKREDGFTIQEVLIVLIVGSILIGLSLSLFLFTNKLFLTWSGTSDLKSETNRILYQMAFDIQQSREIAEHTDTSFVLSRSVGRVVRYSYNGKTLRRNYIELTPQKTARVRVKVVEEHTPDGSLVNAPLFHITGPRSIGIIGLHSRNGCSAHPQFTFAVNTISNSSMKNTIPMKQSTAYDKEEGLFSAIQRIRVRKRVTEKEKSEFSTQLSVMLQAGVSLHRSLEVLARQTKSERLKEVIANLSNEIRKGNSFASALAVQQDVFDSLFVVTVEVGQESGRLPEGTGAISNAHGKNERAQT